MGSKDWCSLCWNAFATSSGGIPTSWGVILTSWGVILTDMWFISSLNLCSVVVFTMCLLICCNLGMGLRPVCIRVPICCLFDLVLHL